MRTESMGSYLQAVKEQRLAVNIGMLTGGGTMRAQAAGFGVQRLDDVHYRSIHAAIEQALADGALGVSLGLGYAPECFYTTEELIRALAPLQNPGIPITVHMRQEGSGVEAALEEMIAGSKALRTPVEISHLKSIGKANWHGSTPNMLRRMARAREKRRGDFLRRVPVYGGLDAAHSHPAHGVPEGRTRGAQRKLKKTRLSGADQKAHGDGKRL
ncbi:MAG: hypothetical protein V8T00_04325 [Oscillospiraceae bacterium]